MDREDDDYRRGREYARAYLDEANRRALRGALWISITALALMLLAGAAIGGFYWYFEAHPEYEMFRPDAGKHGP